MRMRGREYRSNYVPQNARCECNVFNLFAPLISIISFLLHFR